jgi:hypothetical protein
VIRKTDRPRCLRCHDTRFVCEQHLDQPWPHPCAGPGVPCPLCQLPNERPELPDGWTAIASTAPEASMATATAPTDAAFVELLASLDAAVTAAAFALDTAKALANSHRSGERLSTYTLELTTRRIERNAAELEKLRAHVATFKAMFRLH